MLVGIVSAVAGVLKYFAAVDAAENEMFWASNDIGSMPVYPFTPPDQVSASTQKVAIENALPVVAVVSVAFVAYTFVKGKK